MNKGKQVVHLRCTYIGSVGCLGEIEVDSGMGVCC